MAKFAVLVYSGPGVSGSSVAHTIKTLRTLLQPYYIVSELSPAQLLNEPWPNTCALLVIPGGRDIPYQDALGGKGNARIRAFVEAGGSYLGICAGGYYGAAEVRFMLDDPVYKVHAKRELVFWPGPCEGLVFPGFRYQSEEGSRPIELELALDELEALGAMDAKARGSLKSPARHIYYNGGGAFYPPSDGKLPSGAKVLARYSQAADAPAAAVFNEIGRGRAILVGAHPEYSLLDEPLQASLKRHYVSEDMPDKEALRKAEANRLELMRVLLRALAVALPDQHAFDLELLQRPIRPLPQILVAHPSQPGALKVIEAALEPHFAALAADSATPGPRVLKDANDTFYYHQAGDLPSVASFLAQQRTTALSPEEEEDLSVVPKHVIVAPREDALTTLTNEGWCPLWDWASFWSALDEQRTRAGSDRRSLNEGEKWRYGDVIYYAEAVSSTQTMLEKNSLLVMSLPTPLISLANYQLAGRGRTSNQWLNPTGCLQASTHFTIRTAMAQKVVFVQYLHALAIVQALDPAPAGADRDVGPLGLRIKWPNDIYAVVKTKGADGKELEEKLKMGGVLVNSNYSRGAFKITSGAGVNILNRLPTTALVKLVEAYNASLPEDAEPRPLPTMETSLAAITARFEQMLKVFLEAPSGGFEPFIRDYEDRWLHSDQLVHLQSTDPPTAVRISTITLDYGLLRTVPVKGAASYGGGEYDGFRTAARAYREPEFIDLQPDGNSFDIMANMIRRKN